MKKRLFISMLTALIISANRISLRANAITLGDANDDAVINAGDASVVLEHSASIGAGNNGTLFGNALASADVNADGTVDANDASEILIYAAELGAGGSPVFSGENQVTDDEWKQAYQIQLASLPADKNYSYDLADINQDSIPELFIILQGETETTTIYSYQDGICQPVIFQTKNGAVTTSLNTIIINYSADTNSLLAWNNSVGDEYQITNNIATVKHQYIEDFSGEEIRYYYDDTSITEEQWNALFENTESYFYYWLYFCSVTDTSLLDVYSTTGTLQATFAEDSVLFNPNDYAIHYDINLQNISENCQATVSLVPHGTAHTLEAVENLGTDNMYYIYTSIHDTDKTIYVADLDAGEYDLFMLADDGVTELDSITVTIPKDTRYKQAYQDYLSSLSGSDYMYSLYDLDNNGIPELFISNGDYHAAGVEVYTCYLGSLLQLSNGAGSYGTTKVSGNILLSWGYGMDYEHAEFYRMTDSTTLELQDEFSINHNTNPAEYQYFGTDITEAEYNELHAPYDNLSYIELGRDYNITNINPIQNYN